jgi:crotonobetainyl-CoA:carnitine CoA-transferase CaiB-like acyl-CoA transferase
MQKPLKGLKVVELAGVLAGPATGLFLAELGADVLKIENKKTGGDVTRSWKLPSEKKDQEGSAYFYSVNLLKKILFADLTSDKERVRIINKIKSADVLIVNFKKGDDKKFGLTYAELKKVNPTLIYACITGFGEDDERVAYDLVLQAESGFMSMNGTSASGPVKMPVALIDLMAAHQLKEGILLALMNRMKNGRGCKVSVSLFDAAIASLANQASNFLNAGFIPGLQGSLHPNIAPYGEIFVTKDNRKITFAVGSDAQFRNLCAVLKVDEIATQKDFADNQSRIKNRRKLFFLLQTKIKNVKGEPLLNSCLKLNIPAARIRNLDEVLTGNKAKKLIIQSKTRDGIRLGIKSFIAEMNVNK